MVAVIAAVPAAPTASVLAAVTAAIPAEATTTVVAVAAPGVAPAATVPAAYEWLFNGVPLPDVSKDETRSKLLEMIVKKVNAALPTLAAQQAGA